MLRTTTRTDPLKTRRDRIASHRTITKVRGWTFVEMLVAMSMSAIFFGATALVLRSISVNSNRLTSLIDLTIGEAEMSNFYGTATESITAYSAPNYGRISAVQDIIDQFREDAGKCSAIYCLPRAQRNTIRGEFLRYTAGDDGSTEAHPLLDSPEAFRQFLLEVEDLASAIYDTEIRNVPNANRPNTTIFMVSPETSPSYIRLLAVYEIDFVDPTNASGTYVTVRRYKNESLTAYYDIYYEDGDGDGFSPQFVVFEQESRLAVDEGTAIDRFKVAPYGPFYMMWFPDPSINPYTEPAYTKTESASSPREAYEHMTGKTGFMLTVPIFPSF